MKRYLAAAALAAGSLFSAAASAEVTVDARYGLIGWGDGAAVEVAFNAAPNAAIRLMVSDTDNKYDETYSDVRYDATYKLRTAGLFFDWRPASGVFFLTGGLIHASKNELIGTATGQATIDGVSTAANATLRAEITWDKKTVPYFGVGWGNVGTPNKGLAWSVNLGVAFVGDLDVHLSGTNLGTVTTANLGNEERDIEDDLTVMRRLPMAHFGLGYTF
jgi:hypothetical protein